MKIWNKSGNDIYIYGDIVGERFMETDVTAKSLVDDLSGCKGEIQVHINSSGGDVFNALAIYNALKSYQDNVHVLIEGIAASAASLIICAGDVVTMASNALLMIHKPSAGLAGYYDAAALDKVKSSLLAVEGSILNTYKQRLPEKSHAQVAEMLQAETWFNAAEAKDIGFVDEIGGKVEMQVDDLRRLLIVNTLRVNCKKFGDGFKKYEKEIKKVDDKVLIEDAVKAARAEEIQRIKNLTQMKCGVEAVDALIDVAIEDGITCESVKKYVDAVKSVKSVAVEAIKSEIRDNMKSGAENVTGSTPPNSAENDRLVMAKRLAEMANSLRAGVNRGQVH